MANSKVAKGVLVELATAALNAGHSSDDFKAFAAKAIEAGSTESSARQTWQRIKKQLGLTKAKSSPTPKLKAGIAAPKVGRPRPVKGVVEKSSGEAELASLIADGRKYRALVKQLSK